MKIKNPRPNSTHGVDRSARINVWKSGTISLSASGRVMRRRQAVQRKMGGGRVSRKRTWIACLVVLEVAFAIYFYLAFPLIQAIVTKAPTAEILSLVRPIGKVLPFVLLAATVGWIIAISDVIRFGRPNRAEWIAGILLFPPLAIAIYYATFVHHQPDESKPIVGNGGAA